MTVQHGKERLMDSAIASLLAGRNIAAAAAACGVSKRTLQRWLKHDEFRKQYDAAKRELLEGTINKLRSVGGEAVEALREVVTDGEAAAGARVSGSRAILETLIKAVEIQELEKRVGELEKTLEDSK